MSMLVPVVLVPADVVARKTGQGQLIIAALAQVIGHTGIAYTLLELVTAGAVTAEHYFLHVVLDLVALCYTLSAPL